MSTDSLPWTPFLLATVPALMSGAIQAKGLPIKRVIAAILYGALIWGLVSWRSDVGMAFAWVGAIASLLENGNVIFKFVERIV